MKSTVFRFELQLTAGDDSTSLEDLRETLVTKQGVHKVEAQKHGDRIDLDVHATFSDGEEAKKLHRALMNALIGTRGVRLSHVSTNLTEVFG